MRVEVVRAFALGEGRVAAVGEVFDLPDGEARALLARGRVRPAPEAAAPVPVSRDPVVARTRRRPA